MTGTPGFFERFVHLRYRGALPVFAIVLVAVGRTYGEVALYPDLIVPTIFVAKLAHLIAFYTASFFLLSVVLAAGMGIAWERAAGATSVGMAAGALPPLIDGALGTTDGAVYRYFDTFSWAFTSADQPIGETIVLWLVVVGSALFAGALTRSLLRGLVTGVGAWVAMQAVLWGFLAATRALVPSPAAGELVLDLAFLGVSMILFVAVTWRRAWPSLRRFNHALPWAGIAATGAMMEGQTVAHAALWAVVAALLFEIVVFHNDWYDRDDDEERTGRPTADDVTIWWLLAAGLVGSLGVRYPYHFGLMALFLFVWTAYHAPPLRLKRRFCLSYKTEGTSGLLVFLMGATGPHSAPQSPGIWGAALLVGAGVSLVSMAKDWKDVEADRAAGVFSIYVLLSRAGRSERAIHAGVTIAVLLALLVPVVVLAVSGAAPAATAGLVVLALAASAVIWWVRPRRRAVETWLWFLAAYLAVLAVAVAGWRGGPAPSAPRPSAATMGAPSSAAGETAALVARARANLAAGRHLDAMRDARAVLKVAPDDPEARAIEAEVRRWLDAEHALRRAVAARARGDDAAAREAAGQIPPDMPQHRKAQQLLDR